MKLEGRVDGSGIGLKDRFNLEPNIIKFHERSILIWIGLRDINHRCSPESDHSLQIISPCRSLERSSGEEEMLDTIWDVRSNTQAHHISKSEARDNKERRQSKQVPGNILTPFLGASCFF